MPATQDQIVMTVDSLCERLDIETGCSGLSNHLRKLIEPDTSPVENIKIEEELYEGGDWDWDKDNWRTPPTYVITSFIIWTQDNIYHSYTSEGVYLFEVGTVFKVPRNP